MSQELRSGYSTGTHATAILGAVLEFYKESSILEKIEVFLPQEKTALIDVKYESPKHLVPLKQIMMIWM